jgi:hypothetical protein
MRLQCRWIGLALAMLQAGCGVAATRDGDSAALHAQRLFKQRCESAGEKIKRTVDNVEGIFVLKLRPAHVNFGDQFVMDDPYGSDLPGEDYLQTFLREFYDVRLLAAQPAQKQTRSMLPSGYSFVEAIRPTDNVRHRYTGRVEEPWLNNKHYLKGYKRFAMNSKPAPGYAPRYGVDYHDISTAEDRKLWIAGSSLKVIDLQTGEVIAERIGYMYDPAQGYAGGGRSPWLLAANYACPSFGSPHGATFQDGQALRFVEKVLHPIQVK